MRKLICFLGILTLISCKTTYSVTTLDDLNNIRDSVFNIITTNNYSFVSETICDSNGYINEEYIFVNKDSLYLSFKYNKRYITEADIIPYLDNITVDCCCNNLCESIKSIIDNTNKTTIKVYNDESLTGLFIVLFSIPFVTLFGYCFLTR